MTPEQIAFVKNQIAIGKTDEEISTLLQTHGYTVESITSLLTVAHGGEQVPMPTIPTPVQLPPVVAFAHLVYERLRVRPTLLLVTALFTLVMAGVTAIFKNYEALGISSGLVETFLIPVLFAIVMSSVLYGTVMVKNLLNPNPDTFSEDFSYALQNCFALLGVGVLTALVLMSSFMLFIIPALILLGYLALSQPVAIVEGVRGINVLVRSTELVRGYWWAGLLRFLAIIIPLSIFAGIATGILGLLTKAVPLFETVLSSLIQGFIGLVAAAIVVEMYLSIAPTRPAFNPSQPSSVRTLYQVLAWIMIGLIVILIAGIVLYMVLATL